MTYERPVTDALEAWAMFLLHAGWDRAADELFYKIEQSEAAAASDCSEWAAAFSA
ncbi:hypothetical protein [Sphingobium sp. KCTC 72723]|uniref:hypothetical protein n=1 Tax=Sphingobium sp. KCTC 72723 TaxID=2733867 RepID=UPI00165E11C8|nr:hypothetical protein [Sphingobium sp. KCTC 72723]